MHSLHLSNKHVVCGQLPLQGATQSEATGGDGQSGSRGNGGARDNGLGEVNSENAGYFPANLYGKWIQGKRPTEKSTAEASGT